jgi:hypothetical protein
MGLIELFWGRFMSCGVSLPESRSWIGTEKHQDSRLPRGSNLQFSTYTDSGRIGEIRPHGDISPQNLPPLANSMSSSQRTCSNPTGVELRIRENRESDPTRESRRKTRARRARTFPHENRRFEAPHCLESESRIEFCHPWQNSMSLRGHAQIRRRWASNLTDQQIWAFLRIRNG